jgi:putative tricarboxylic transport membrane protein
LFFLLLAVFSLGFPWFQKDRGKKKWTLVYIPIMCLTLTIPLFLMGGIVRPTIGAILILISLNMLRKRTQEGWHIEDKKDFISELRE